MSDFDGIWAPKSLVFSIDTIKLATEANFPNQIYKTKSTEPICTFGTLKQICQTKYTRLKLQNLFYQTKCLNCKEPNTLKQIYRDLKVVNGPQCASNQITSKK